MHYTQRVRDSILPLSVGGTLPRAFDEWRFTGHTVDHGDADETCELCAQQGLRYHFQIANDYNGNSLWVGSHCILAFELGVYDEGRRLSSEEAAKLLDKHVQQMRLDSCVAALAELAKAEDNAILTSALAFYQKNKFLTPKFAFVVFWKLQQKGIDHDPSFFKINLRKKRYREDLRDMSTQRVHFFWNALASSQKKIAVDLGHQPPESKAERAARLEAFRRRMS